jgi:hypothetical protein
MKKILSLGICIILHAPYLFSQQPFYKSSVTGNSNVYESGDGETAKIGVGLTDPSAKLHVKKILTEDLYQPSIRVDLFDNIFSIQTRIGTFEALVKNDYQYFGIYQTGQSNWINYLQNRLYVDDPIFLQNNLQFLQNDQDEYKITIDNRDTDDEFVFTFLNPYNEQLRNLLILDPMVGVTTHGLLTTDRFRMIEGAGDNKIMVCNQEGVGTWADGSEFHDDDWLISTPHGEGILQNLYKNPKYQSVGIGTTDPLQMLHVRGGNILISRSPDEAPGSLNGSIYFGAIVDHAYPNGEWGIEYYNEGLNFWKVASASNPGGNYRLFLKNNGNVGINSENPLDKFQVNDGFEKLSVGSANSMGSGAGTSYVGFNAVKGQENWSFSSNGTSNGGNITYGDIEGNYHILTVPTGDPGTNSQSLSDSEIAEHIRLSVTKDGDVGIGTINTHGYKLAVRGKILCENLKVQLEEDWPDYVFNKDYRLIPLQELESYINVNKHLPGIPSSEEIKEDGIDVSRMNAVLVQKIEELTRYIIDQQKQIELQQKQIDLLIKNKESN